MVPVSVITVPLAHYFVVLDQTSPASATVYLVTWQDLDLDDRIDLGGALGMDQRRYFRWSDDGDGLIGDHELTPVTDPAVLSRLRPAISDDAGRFLRFQTDREALQKFVNWFTYHRRREFVLKDVVATAISRMDHILVGFYAINDGPRIPVQPIQAIVPASTGAAAADVIQDQTGYLLDALYAMNSLGDTPLRVALDQVGRYFDQGRHLHARQCTLPYRGPWRRLPTGSCRGDHRWILE